jgi:NAD-dependent deacetylase
MTSYCMLYTIGMSASLSSYRKVVVLTGAGISRAAGLPTYRGPGGLWNDPAAVALSDVAALRTRRAEACAMFRELYEASRGVEPTAAHRALAAFEAHAAGRGASFTLITQNVDGLHQRAGSQSVCEYHGSLARWRCDECGAEQEPPAAADHCGQPMRPCAVLFGEQIPAAAERTAKIALRDCDLFVAIGTSGTVFPAAGFVRSAAYAGARTLLLNLELDDAARDLYRECHAGPADELVPRLFSPS